jgi:hypothetical protein
LHSRGDVRIEDVPEPPRQASRDPLRRVGGRRPVPRGIADWFRFPSAATSNRACGSPHTAHRRPSPPAFGSPRGVGLGRPVERPLQFSDSVLLGGHSHDRHSPAFPCTRRNGRSSGPSHHRGFCCPVERYYGRLRRPPGSPPTSRLLTGYRARRSHGSPQPPGRGGPPQFPPPPSERSAPSTPGGSSGLHLQALHPFHGLRPEGRGSAPPPPARGGHTNGAAGFA